MAETTKKSRARATGPGTSALEGVPELVTHRKVAKLFAVTPEAIRKWVDKGQFPAPHSIIAQTWFYRADWVAHRLRTGRWPDGVRFRGDRP